MPTDPTQPTAFPPLHPDDCQVWWARTSDARAEQLELLDPVEAQRWQRFRHDGDRARLLVGVTLAKTLLGATLDADPRDVVLDRTCPQCARPHGKPRLQSPVQPTGPPPQLSVSHSGDRVAVAITWRAPVGVDVERTTSGAHLERTASAVLTERELQPWQALPPELRRSALIRAWTRKESLLKATGDGLRLPLGRLGLAERDGRPVVEQWPPDSPAPPAQLHDLHPDGEYLACLAVLDDRPCRVIELDGTALLRHRALARTDVHPATPEAIP